MSCASKVWAWLSTPVTPIWFLYAVKWPFTRCILSDLLKYCISKSASCLFIFWNNSFVIWLHFPLLVGLLGSHYFLCSHSWCWVVCGRLLMWGAILLWRRDRKIMEFILLCGIHPDQLRALVTRRVHPSLWSTPLTNCVLQLQDLVDQRAFPPPHLSILWI